MKRWMWAVALAAGISSSGAATEENMVDGVVAVVNDRVITLSQVLDYVQPVLPNLRRHHRGEELRVRVREAQRAALDDLIDQALILDDFKAQGFTMPDNAADHYLNEIIGRDYSGDRAAFLKTLEARGQTLSQFREQARDRMIIQAMYRRQTERHIVVSPYQIEKYYQDNQDKFRVGDQIKLRMIFIKKLPPPPAPVPAAETEPPAEPAPSAAAPDPRRQLAADLLAKLDAGESFDALARAHSEGKEAGQGGDWGWIGRDVLRKEFNEVAFQLAPGQHSRVIETDDGYYLLRVDDTKAAHVKPLADVRPEIEAALLQEQRTRMEKQWVQQLRAKAYIRIF